LALLLRPFGSTTDPMKAPAFRLVLLLACLVLLPTYAFAGSATWKPHPTSGDWNNAANWKPRTIPNGSGDVATFGVSDTTNVKLPAKEIEVDRVVFNPGASAFTLQADYSSIFTLSGTGITNSSGLVQNFVIFGGYGPGLTFTNQATAGAQTNFTVGPELGQIDFHDEATAGSAIITIVGTEFFEDGSAGLGFYENSTAANAVITNTGGSGEDSQGGATLFSDDSTAANASITNEACTDSAAYYGGGTVFIGNATAGDAVITSEGGADQTRYLAAGDTAFLDSATAGNAIITTTGGAGAATLDFYDTTSAGNATLIATGGSNGSDGGIIRFWETADGGTARVELFGNGTLDVSGVTDAGVSIGSLEGDGIVSTGATTLTIGTNNLSTVFSGVIQGTGTGRGTLIKEGSGTLTLSGANTYTGYTVVLNGFLRVDNRTGSATGIGTVLVYGPATIGGGGIIGGTLTTSGGVLAPGTGAATLTVKRRLTINNGPYTWRVKTASAQADKVIANEVDLNGAVFSGIAVGHAVLPPGTTFIAIKNTSSDPIIGTFNNLPDDGRITIGSNTFQANYEGGDGNDLTLTVVSN